MAIEQSSKPSRRKTTEGRRRLIVEAAATCFAEKGFHQASIRDIANKAGISLGNLYNHFDSKHALITEIATLEAEDLETMRAVLAGSDAPLQALERFVKVYLDYTSQPANAVLSAEITAEAMRNPEIAKRFQVNRAALLRALKTVLLKGVAQKQFDARINADEMSQQILDLLDSVGTRMAFSKKRAALRSRETVQRVIRRAVVAAP